MTVQSTGTTSQESTTRGTNRKRQAFETRVESQILSNSAYNHYTVIAAAVLGSPIAGGVLMTLKSRRLGRPIVVVTAAVTAIALVALLFQMESAGNLAAGAKVSALGIARMTFAAKPLQGKQVHQHVQSDGAQGSGWNALGHAILGMILIVPAALMLSEP